MKIQSFVNKPLEATFGWLPARVALGAVTLLGFVNLYMVRINLSVAIVAMVNHNDTATEVSAAECLAGRNFNNITSGNRTTAGFLTTGEIEMDLDEEDEHYGEDNKFDRTSRSSFDWNEVTQGFVLSGFGYGYAVTQVMGGRQAEVRGTKLVFGICILMGGIISLLTPLMANLHYGALIALRVLLGLCQGVSWPSVHALLARWIPPLERPRFVSIVYFAATFSITLTFPLCGVIIASHGWEAVFYVCGACSLIWCFFWFTCMHDDPTQHPRISDEEKNYIVQSVRSAGKSSSPSTIAPWKQIYSSSAVWAIIVCDMGNSFGLTLFSKQLPTYIRNVLGFPIAQNGLLSGIPFFCRYLGAVSSGVLVDWLTSRGHLSILVARKLFCSIAMFGPALFMIGVIYSGCSTTTIMIMLGLAFFLNGSIACSQQVNHADIAPNFAGTLFGVSNTLASVSSSIAPVAVGAVIRDQQTIGQWQKAFWMTVPIYIVSGLFFLVFGSVNVQSWNNIGQKDNIQETGGGDEDYKDDSSSSKPLNIEEHAEKV